MVVSIRDIGNKSFYTSASQTIASNMTLTKNINITINVNDLFKGNCNNYDEVRNNSLASSVHCSRTLSLSLSDCDEDYTTQVQRESDRMVEDDPVAPTNSPQLENVTPNS